MKKLFEIMDNYDKEVVGFEIDDELILNESKKKAMFFALASNFPCKFLFETDMLYVCDEKGNRFMVPNLYESVLSDYNLEKAYFEDIIPKLYQINFQTPNGVGIVYLVYDMDGDEVVLANNPAKEYIKYLDEKALTSLLITEYRSNNQRANRKAKKNNGK